MHRHVHFSQDRNSHVTCGTVMTIVRGERVSDERFESSKSSCTHAAQMHASGCMSLL